MDSGSLISNIPITIISMVVWVIAAMRLFQKSWLLWQRAVFLLILMAVSLLQYSTWVNPQSPSAWIIGGCITIIIIGIFFINNPKKNEI